jgi:pimeloyl-ACP methyl ester carboxylesterase
MPSFVTSDGVSLHYTDTGVDRRSHGRSGAPAYGQRMARHGKDRAEALDAIGLASVVAVGGSMGASTWWSYLDLFGPRAGRAAAGRAHPGHPAPAARPRPAGLA